MVKMGENGGNEKLVINESMNMKSDSLTCDDKLFVVFEFGKSDEFGDASS